jgi:O-antigen ligase
MHLSAPGPKGRRAAAASSGLVYDGRYGLLVALVAWLLIVFMILPDSLDYAGRADVVTEGSPLSRAIWLFLLGFGLVIVLWRRSLAWALLRDLNPFLLLFGLVAAASVAWSIEPAITLRRMVRFVTVLLDAAALVLVAWQPRRPQQVLRPVLTAVLLGSIVFGILAPELAIEQENELRGAWHGLAIQKNEFGSLAGMALLLWLHAWLARESRSFVPAAGVALSALCIWLSRSSTSLMATAFAIVFLLMLLRSPVGLRRYMPYVVGLFAIALLVYALAVLQLVPALGFLLRPIVMITGKDLTFSNRTAIWQIINEHIAQAPIRGSGYAAYWTGATPASPSYEMLRRLYFYPLEAHNGYLDVINDLGLIGGLCLLGYLLVYLRQSLRLLALDRSQGALYLALFFEQIISNLSESRWLNVLTVEFAIMSIITFAQGRALLQARFDARPAPMPALAPVAPAPRRRRR